MCKKRMQGHDWVFRISYSSKYDENFYMISISFAILNFECYYILILFQKDDIILCKMEIFEK